MTYVTSHIMVTNVILPSHIYLVYQYPYLHNQFLFLLTAIADYCT